jgi:glucose-6-phosphate isomerase
MQLIHQSPTPVPADFIICKTPSHSLIKNHQSLMANFLAQTRALAIGQTLEEADGDASRVFTGNRPTTSIVLPELTPFTLGLLIAAYEHKVFVQGIVWNLNSYDQPGVELGKKLAKPLRAMIENGEIDTSLDNSTQELLKLLTR